MSCRLISICSSRSSICLTTASSSWLAADKALRFSKAIRSVVNRSTRSNPSREWIAVFNTAADFAGSASSSIFSPSKKKRSASSNGMNAFTCSSQSSVSRRSNCPLWKTSTVSPILVRFSLQERCKRYSSVSPPAEDSNSISTAAPSSAVVPRLIHRDKYSS